jgi:hypothetical protein
MHDIRILTEADAVEPYLRDESSFTGHAEAVAVVEDARDAAAVAALLRDCTAAGRPVTFSARRTSLTGAAVPEGGLVIGLPALAGPEHVHIDVEACPCHRPGLGLHGRRRRRCGASGSVLPAGPDQPQDVQPRRRRRLQREWRP